jgi:hypothetical protein
VVLAAGQAANADRSLQELSIRISAAVFAVALLAGCGNSRPNAAASSIDADRSPEGAPQVHVHANGLQLAVSAKAYQVTTTPTGFSLEPPNNDQLRTPFSVSIQLLESPPKATGHRVHYVDAGRMLRYTVTHEEEGGSAGVLYTVAAFEHVGNHWIQYSQTRQAEEMPGEVFQIARGVRYVPATAD